MAKAKHNKIKNLIVASILLMTMLGFLNANATEEAKVLNVYCWTNYVPTKILEKFTKETGIRVNLSEYDSNETMFAKLKASPRAGYDIVIPSNYFMERMSSQKMLQKIDKSKIPNFKNINSALLKKSFDPNNDFSIPYLWGATGIAVNSDYFDPKSISRWRDLWNPKYKNQLLVLNDLREVFGMALIALGYSADDKNPEHIKQAYLKLKELLPNIKIFNSDAEQTIYIDEDVVIGMGYNGDIHLTQEENPKIKFIFPKDGFVIWIDSLAITKHALHVENAHKFINFLLRPDVAKAVSLSTGYSTPNKEAIKLLPKEMQNLEVINPSAETMKRAELQGDLGEALEIYEKYWELLKIGA